MKLIFGLGNPGIEYDGTRHNTGFEALNYFASKQGSDFIKKDKFKAEVAEVLMNGDKILLARPVTFYNEVGTSYRSICDFYKLAPSDTLIVHDELSLPLGTLRIREGGSDAGNNGIKSINQHGGQASWRLRIGISNDDRQLIGDADFVLSKFKQAEFETLQQTIIPATHTLMEDFIHGSLSPTSHRHATKK